MKRTSLDLLSLVVAATCTTVPAPGRAAPVDTVLAAVAAEAAAPSERVRLYVQRGDVADVYYIDRLRPGRLRVVANPRQNGLEMIIIDDRQWLRNGSRWEASPAPPNAMGSSVPSLAPLFQSGLKDAHESIASDGSTRIEGTMAWMGATACRGRLTVTIDASGRPVFLAFDGECGKKPTIFHQAMAYDTGFAIDPPR